MLVGGSENMDIKYKKSSAVLFIYLSGELDEYAANMSRSVLDKLLDENLNAGKVVFDMSGLNFMDSTGIGMLIGRYKKLKNFGIPVYIAGANNAIEKVITLSGQSSGTHPRTLKRLALCLSTCAGTIMPSSSSVLASNA